MARPLRIEYPGAFYHVTARGNERKNIFKSYRDRQKYLPEIKDNRNLPALRKLSESISLEDIDKQLSRKVALILIKANSADAKKRRG